MGVRVAFGINVGTGQDPDSELELEQVTGSWFELEQE